jgi:peroxiredoxin
MVRVGQRIDDLEFEFYQNDDIKKGKFSDYPGKWLVLLFYPADFTFTRFRSRQEHTFAEKLLSAMRYKFGGHVERPTGG